MMPTWLRVTLAIAAGYAVWFTVATVGNLAIRWVLPGYAEVEKAMNFSFAMLIARLVVGAVASLAAGVACIAIGRSGRAGVYLVALLLLAVCVPVHAGL